MWRRRRAPTTTGTTCPSSVSATPGRVLYPPLPLPPPPTPTPTGGRGCLMSLSCLESQGCPLIPLSYLLPCFLFFCLDLFPPPPPPPPPPFFFSCSFCLVIFLRMVHSPDFFFLSRKLKYFPLRVRLFFVWLSLSGQEIGVGGWYVQLAAIWRWR